jgi:O-antigen ligase
MEHIHQTRHREFAMTRRLAVVVTGAIDMAILASIVVGSPLAAIGAFAFIVFASSCVFMSAGFTAMVAAISGVAVIGDIDFNAIRTIKWAIVAASGTIAFTRLWLEHRVGEIEFDFVAKYFLLYIGWGTFCSIFAVHPSSSVSIVLMKSMFFAIYVLTVVFVLQKKDVSVILGILLAYVLASGSYSFGVIASGSFVRFSGFLDNANGYGAALSVIVPLLFAAYHIYSRRVTRLLFATGVFVGVLCIALSWSRGAWVANFVAAVVFLVMEKRRKALLVVITLTATIAIIVVSTSSAFSVFYQLARLRGGGTTHRTALWESALKEIKESPVVGKGFGLKADDVMTNVRGADPMTWYYLREREGPYNPHSYYLLPVVATGIPGLLIFLHFFYNLFRSQYRGWRNATDPRYRILHATMFSMLAGAGVGLLVDSGMVMGSGSYANYFWIALGLVTAISRKRLLDSPADGQVHTSQA